VRRFNITARARRRVGVPAVIINPALAIISKFGSALRGALALAFLEGIDQLTPSMGFCLISIDHLRRLDSALRDRWNDVDAVWN